MVDSYGTTLGFMEVDAQEYSRLVQANARKRLGSDQLKSDHEHALRLTNNECKHE